ncbi:MAG TPA: helix-turn-helix domain-containing protein [Pyrinomonadaceae bacterium]|jgi:ribosome-binding protein aMBF1 (putative translation factor)
MPKAKPKPLKVTHKPLADLLNDGSKEFEELTKKRLAQLDIAQDIIKRRKALGLSQTELARRAGVNQPLISRIESGNFKNFEIQTLIRIATALEARYDFNLVVDPQEPDAFSPPAATRGASA